MRFLRLDYEDDILDLLTRDTRPLVAHDAESGATLIADDGRSLLQAVAETAGFDADDIACSWVDHADDLTIRFGNLPSRHLDLVVRRDIIGSRACNPADRFEGAERLAAAVLPHLDDDFDESMLSWPLAKWAAHGLQSALDDVVADGILTKEQVVVAMQAYAADNPGLERWCWFSDAHPYEEAVRARDSER